jgi:Mn-dependent DtxR family transcriptional regulator
MTLSHDLSEFEDLLRSYPASKFVNYHRDYAAKASIAGRIACERLTEQEKTIEELSKESRKLKLNFDLAQAMNLDLEKKVAELAEALKRCQDGKKIPEEGKKVTDEALE